MRPHSKALVRLLSVLVGLGCGDSPTGWRPGGPDSASESVTLPGLILSGTSPVSSSVRPWVGAGTAGITYVSLLPGTLPTAASVEIRNLTTRAAGSVGGWIVDGGFDPIPVAAIAGDLLELTFAERSGGMRIERGTVPERRPPSIVRVSPARGRTDIPLSVRPRVVFSEPVDAPTLAGKVELRLGGAVVPGEILLVPEEPWIAEVVVETLLRSSTTYELSVSAGILDLDGDALASSLSSTFTTAESRTEGRIAFASTRDGSPHVYVVWADGAGLVRLAPGEAPAWSPDGTRIAFTTWPGGVPGQGASEVHLIDVDGSGRRMLVGDGASAPNWSPDGTRIAFVRDGEIFAVDADGSGETPLISRSSVVASTGWVVPVDLDRPAWSPDGTRIAFVAVTWGGDGGGGMMMAEGDGSSPRPLDLNGMGPSFGTPSWSPDGSRVMIGMSGGMDPVSWVITASPDGFDVRIHEDGASPDWSPDGTSYVYYREKYRLAPCCERIFIGSIDNAFSPFLPIPEPPIDPSYRDYDPVWSRAR